MQTTPATEDEADRLRTLIGYRILELPREGEFDACARLIARICGMEIGAVTLSDQNRQWVKAAHGPMDHTIPWRDAFFAHTIMQDGVMEVPDVLVDPRYSQNPSVTSDFPIRSYAGVAMKARNGLALGTVCVMDRYPRRLTQAQRTGLEIAGAHIGAQLEIRLSAIQLLEERKLALGRSEAMRLATKQRSDLAALVVHDLRNPLVSVTANSQFLAHELTLTEDQRSALQDIIDAGEKLTGMVNDLLYVSRAEDGHLLIRRKVPVDLAEVARSAVARCRTVAANSGIRIDFKQGPSDGIIEGDKDLLFRVVTNLLENACKYGPSNSRVQVAITVEGQRAVLRVLDEGKGIPKEQRRHVFEKYFQADQHATPRPSFGLGLSFCRLAIEAHHGQIEVEDVQNGCSFRVSLPLRGAESASDRGTSGAPEDGLVLAEPLGGQRETTDMSLSQERFKTDSLLGRKGALLDRDADTVVDRAREAADKVVNIARQQEDQNLDHGEKRGVSHVMLDRDRLRADTILSGERSAEDKKLHAERDAFKHVLADLLGLERAETDNHLQQERMEQLEKLKSIEQVITDLNFRIKAQSQTVEEAVRTRDSFLSMASHELRSPLSALQLQVQGLLRDARASTELVPPAVLRRIVITERHVKRLESLADRLFDVTALSTGELEVEGSVDLSALVWGVVERMRMTASQAGCDLTVQASSAVEGRWDRGRLERVITNLLTNAIKFGAGRPITVRLKGDRSTTWLSVEDQGIGIDPKDHRRIFECFERAVSDRNYAGFGLGLWMVKRIVDTLGGDVSVVSTLGSGATFTVQLPN